jgi:hypothetical protein
MTDKPSEVPRAQWTEPEAIPISLIWMTGPNQGWVTVTPGVQVRLWNHSTIQVRRLQPPECTDLSTP